MKEIKLSEHGNYLFGVLDGVYFVQSGTLENGSKYGASIKLKFMTTVTVVKIVAGVDIPTKKAISQTIKMATVDSELPTLVHKYNEFIGKELLINYGAGDGNIFIVQDEKSVSIIK